MSKLDRILDHYINRNIGRRNPTIEDVANAYRDGMMAVKKGTWNFDGMPRGKKPVVGLFLNEERELSIRSIDPETIGNLSGMVAWAYLSSIVSTKSILDDAKKHGEY